MNDQFKPQVQAAVQASYDLASLIMSQAQRATELAVIGDHAECALVALQRVFRVGRRRRDLHDAGIAIDLRSRNRHARIQVTDHGHHMIVDQLLGERARAAA